VGHRRQRRPRRPLHRVHLDRDPAGGHSRGVPGAPAAGPLGGRRRAGHRPAPGPEPVRDLLPVLPGPVRRGPAGPQGPLRPDARRPRTAPDTARLAAAAPPGAVPGRAHHRGGRTRPGQGGPPLRQGLAPVRAARGHPGRARPLRRRPRCAVGARPPGGSRTACPPSSTPAACRGRRTWTC
jgi:hypothetical protein